MILHSSAAGTINNLKGTEGSSERGDGCARPAWNRPTEREPEGNCCSGEGPITLAEGAGQLGERGKQDGEADPEGLQPVK